MPNTALTFDIGGTKIAWAIVTEDGVIKKHGREETPHDRTKFLAVIDTIIRAHPANAVGIGIAGVFSDDHTTLISSPNIPELRNLELRTFASELMNAPAALDNDARCALIGEVWKGAAQDTSSAVLITIGTGIGGAVMQREVVLPHPRDISREISHIVADSNDLFPTVAGRGTIEALLGGKSLEARFGWPMHELVAAAKKKDEEALEVWKVISYYFDEAIEAIYSTFRCKMIIVGGKGLHDLEMYMQNPTPCPVIPAALGEDAALIGAARLAFDALDKSIEDAKRDWDE